jgi:phytanoyl-CoA hydroxylase
MNTSSTMTSLLSSDYATHGFARLGRIMDQAQLERFHSEEERLRCGQSVDPNAKASTIFTNNLCWKSTAVRDFCQHGAHLDAVRELIGPDILMWWTQLVTKMPEGTGATSIFPWHQDCGYLDITPTPLTVWIALDDVTLDNGCLWIQPGSHSQGLREHAKISDDSWHLSLPVEGDGVAVPLKAGEAIIFSAYTLHRSLSNRTSRLRRAFFCSYAVSWGREAATLRPLLPERDIHVISGQQVERPLQS